MTCEITVLASNTRTETGILIAREKLKLSKQVQSGILKFRSQRFFQRELKGLLLSFTAKFLLDNNHYTFTVFYLHSRLVFLIKHDLRLDLAVRHSPHESISVLASFDRWSTTRAFLER